MVVDGEEYDFYYWKRSNHNDQGIGPLITVLGDMFKFQSKEVV